MRRIAAIVAMALLATATIGATYASITGTHTARAATRVTATRASARKTRRLYIAFTDERALHRLPNRVARRLGGARRPRDWSWHAASTFDDGPGTACGFRATYGFATRESSSTCGEGRTVCAVRCVTALREDWGPAEWTGRDYDLNTALWDAIGCPDTPCSIRVAPSR